MSQDTKKIVVVVASVAVFYVLAIAVGGLLMRGHGSHRLTYRQATQPLRRSPDPTVFATVVGKATPGLDLAKMLNATPDALAQGKQLFAADCAACHGAAGKGDGPAAAGLKPAPRNFSSPRGWTRGYTIAEIYTTLSVGVSGTGMPAFDTLSPRKRFALAHYVQSLGKFDHHDDSASETQQLNAKYHLAAGEHAPNKVEVSIIMKHMVDEYVAPPAVHMPAASDASPGARLCRALVADPVRAAQVLSQVPGWRNDVDVFARVVVADTPYNGFRARAAALDQDQWQTFHDELVTRTLAPRNCPSARQSHAPSPTQSSG